MKLCVIGTGYVGLVTGACLADVGNEVVCVDKDLSKIDKLKKSVIPIYEPGLEEVVERNVQKSRLFFVNDLESGLTGASICFITVDTPLIAGDSLDLKNVFAVAQSVGDIINSYTVVVVKSTVPVGTTHKVKEIISQRLSKRGLDPNLLFDVASNPEFLKEGDAVNDFMKPSRVIVGVEKESVANLLHTLYSPFMLRKDRFLQVDIPSSELTKHAANAMLATRISFMNEIARLCEKVGANINHVRRGLGSDPRIGPYFLYAGLGYGGSCLPKDTKSIVKLGREQGEQLTVIDAVDHANERHRGWFWEKILKHFVEHGGLLGKTVAIWGLAFKANTDDVRFSPSIFLIRKLLEEKAVVRAFDPVAMENAKKELGSRSDEIIWANDNYECLDGADALLVCTEWGEFRSPDFRRIKKLMNRGAIIFDGRNIFDIDNVRSVGLLLERVG